MNNPKRTKDKTPMAPAEDYQDSHSESESGYSHKESKAPRPTSDKPRQKPRRSGERLDPCRVPPATPYLIIRSWTDDLGIRPIPAADAGSLYYSPDIIHPFQHASDIKTNLRTWITNAGLAPAAPVKVEFYVIPPTLTLPPVNPILIDTVYTIVQPQSSKLVLSRNITAWNLMSHWGLMTGYATRCSTPFDPYTNTFDPSLDRHVAILHASPINDPTTPVDIRIANWFTGSTTSNVEMVIERLQVTSAYNQTQGRLKQRNLQDDLLRFGETSPNIEEHLAQLSTDKRMRSRSVRRFRRAVRGQTQHSCFPAGLRRSQASPLPSLLQVEVAIKPDSRRLYPTAASLISKIDRRMSTGVETLARLPSHRQILIDGLHLAPLEEREISVQFGSFDKLRSDEYLVVHLFHINSESQNLLGRFSFIVMPKSAQDIQPISLIG